MSEKYFLDEKSNETVIMRRNDGDAVSHHAEDVGNTFERMRAAMRFSQLVAQESRKKCVRQMAEPAIRSLAAVICVQGSDCC
jgi:hypothetical protein